MLTCMGLGVVIKQDKDNESFNFVPIGFKIKGTKISHNNWDDGGPLIPGNYKNTKNLIEYMELLSKVSIKIMDEADDLEDVDGNSLKLIFIDQEG